MKKLSNHLKVPCIGIDKILTLKRLEGAVINDVYAKLKDFIHMSNGDNSILKYIRLLISLVVEDPKTLDPLIQGKDEDQSESALAHIYNSIVEVYAPFRIEFVSGDYNGIIPFGNQDEEDKDPKDIDNFRRMIEERIKQRGEAQSSVATEGAQPQKKTKKKKAQVNKNIINFTSLEELSALKSYLQSNIIGQDQAIDTLCNYMKLKVSHIIKRASMFFIGKTGVGKTLTAELLGKKYSGNFFKINCAEYSLGHEYQKLIGAPPGYIGFTEKSILAQKAEISNKWVFLFDEIEKGHEKLYNLLLNLLDEGTIADNNGRTLDFSESIFIFTSNKGVSDIKDNFLGFKSSGMSDSGTKEELIKALERGFSPEFRNRIDEYIIFNNLEQTHIKDIVRLNLNDYQIKTSDALVNLVTTNSYSPQYGAREVSRYIKRHIAPAIADALLVGKVPSDIKSPNKYDCEIVDGVVKIINTTTLKLKTKDATSKESK